MVVLLFFTIVVRVYRGQRTWLIGQSSRSGGAASEQHNALIQLDVGMSQREVSVLSVFCLREGCE